MTSKVKKLFILSVGLVLLVGSGVKAQTREELEQQIRNRQERINELKKQAAQYEENLKQKRKQRLTLSNQISILTDRISALKVETETLETTIEATSLQIREHEQSIKAREKELTQRKIELAALIRWYDRSQNQSPLKIVFTQPSFADFTNQIRSIRTIQLSMSDLIDSIDAIKTKLQEDKRGLESKRQDLVKDVNALQENRMSLEGQQETKAYLLEETKSSEERYTLLLDAAKREQESTSHEITNLEKEVREKLKERGISTNGDAPIMIWPISAALGITAVFHDPDYPFRRVFEHTGIDIRTPQGTPVRAAAAGYVARARHGGARGYSYIMIVHNGGIATVYGHVSKISVRADSFVAQGQVIGNSGGLPGTSGAGPFSTGAHLHFEVRQEGVPVNPMNYLK